MQKRVAEKKAKVAAIKASHHKYVLDYHPPRSRAHVIYSGLPKTIPTHRLTLHVMLLMVLHVTPCFDAILSALKPSLIFHYQVNIDVLQGLGYS
jgi:hypothetical protein